MEKEKTLYYSVSSSIITDIYCGKWKKGETFLSLQELCEVYGIGRNTARSVVDVLEEKGYVSRKGKRMPEVCFDWDDARLRSMYLKEIMGRKAAIGEVHAFLTATMPQLFTQIIVMLSDREIDGIIETLDNYADAMQSRNELEMAQELIEIYIRVLSTVENQLLEDFFKALFQFIQLPLEKKDRGSMKFKVARKYIKYSIEKMEEAVKLRDDKGLRKLIKLYCQSTQSRSEKYLNRICKGMKEDRNEYSVWYPRNKINTGYLFLALDILRKINRGDYRENEILPSYAKLAEIHGVSEKTVRRTGKVLHEWNVITIINGVGSRVNVLGERKSIILKEDPLVKEIIKEYMEVLQIFSLICRPFILYVIECREERWKKLVKGIEEKQNDLFLKNTIDSLFETETLHVIDHIYSQFREILKAEGLLEACGMERHRGDEGGLRKLLLGEQNIQKKKEVFAEWFFEETQGAYQRAKKFLV